MILHRKEHLLPLGQTVIQVDLSHLLLINQPYKMVYHGVSQNRESAKTLILEIEKNKSRYNFS
jgi:hypothetical protein